MKTDSMHPTASRVLAIPTLETELGAPADAAGLVRAYFGNVKRLAAARGSWSGGPFFTPEELLGAALSPENQGILADVETWLTQPNPDVAKVCLDAVKWAGYADQGEPLAAAHAGLFEPLLQLLERGIAFRVQQGEVLMKGASVPLAAWNA